MKHFKPLAHVALLLIIALGFTSTIQGIYRAPDPASGFTDPGKETPRDPDYAFLKSDRDIDLAHDVIKMNTGTLFFTPVQFENDLHVGALLEAKEEMRLFSHAEKIEQQREELVRYAHTFLGYRYILGGISPSGFDCSGFVYYLYNNYNANEKYPLPRAMMEQARLGVQIAPKELRAGDLLFFTPVHNYNKSNFGHVGMVISNAGGSVKFIHASGRRVGVVISEFNTDFYQKRFIFAKRYLL